jgi:hypothetical protein
MHRAVKLLAKHGCARSTKRVQTPESNNTQTRANQHDPKILSCHVVTTATTASGCVLLGFWHLLVHHMSVNHAAFFNGVYDPEVDSDSVSDMESR